MRRYACRLLTIVMACAFIRVANSAESLTLQQGTDAYRGCSDTTLSIHSRFQPESASEALLVRNGRFYPESCILIKFDLGHIPQDAEVQKAELKLFGGKGKTVTLNAHTMRKAWNSNQATWNRADARTEWDCPGLNVGTDYQAMAIFSIEAGGPAGDWRMFDITGAVQRWVRNPDSNHGLLIKGEWKGLDLGHDRTFVSSDSADKTKRPRLELRLGPQALDPKAGIGRRTPVPSVHKRHPRIWINRCNLEKLRGKTKTSAEEWQSLVLWENQKPNLHYFKGGRQGLMDSALLYLLTNDKRAGRDAVRHILRNCERGLDFLKLADGDPGALYIAVSAMGYDWCHDLIGQDKRKAIIEQFNEWGNWSIRQNHNDPSSSRFYGYLLLETMIGLATYGENPEAEKFLRHARDVRLAAQALPWLKRHGKGGAWYEGNSNYRGPAYLAYSLAALASATGEDLFADNRFLKDTIEYHVATILPAMKAPIRTLEAWKGFYEKGYCRMYPDGTALFAYPYHTYLMHILAHHYAGTRHGARAQWWLKSTSTIEDYYRTAWGKFVEPLGAVISFIFHEKDRPALAEKSLPSSYLAEDAGLFTWRSSWNKDATFFAFSCGPRLARLQSQGANGIYVHKRGDLLGVAKRNISDSRTAVAASIGNKHQTVMPRDREPKLLACHVAEDDAYAYVAGEASGAYNSKVYGVQVCDQFFRQVVIIHPGLFFVYDRITPTDPSETCTFPFFKGSGGKRKGRKKEHYSTSFGGEISGKKADVRVHRGDGSALYFQLIQPKQVKNGETHQLALVYVPEIGAQSHPVIQTGDDEGTTKVNVTWEKRSMLVSFAKQGEIGGDLVIKRDGKSLVQKKLASFKAAAE